MTPVMERTALNVPPLIESNEENQENTKMLLICCRSAIDLSVEKQCAGWK